MKYQLRLMPLVGGELLGCQPVSPQLVNRLQGLLRKWMLMEFSFCLFLFNGIGGAFHAYDLVGASPVALVAFDISEAACRVTSRRWPHAVVLGDVRRIDRKMVHGWLLRYPHVEQVDFWAGFPCTDLNSVKANRLHLQGSESGLFSEVLRVLELLLQVFGRNFPIYYFIENVASMDRAAAQEISEALGVRPYRVQSSDAVPMSRPRYCWSNCALPLLPGVHLEDKGFFVEVRAMAEYPKVSQLHVRTPGGNQRMRLPYSLLV